MSVLICLKCIYIWLGTVSYTTYAQINLPPVQRCVLPGTCSSTSTTGRPTIDLRIVLPSNPTAPGCPAGLVPCTGTVSVQCGAQYVQNPSTVDGQSTPGAFPWQVYLTNQTGFTGSGVLLDNIHVFTAAHKVYLNRATPSNILVRFGVFDPNSMTGVISRSVARIDLMDTWNVDSLIDDVAILTLNSSVELAVNPQVNPICLPAQGATFLNQNCLVSGWGQSQFNIYDSPVSPLKQVVVRIVSYETCRDAYIAAIGSEATARYLNQQRNLCAGGEANKDACTNDGGGPLICSNGNGGYVVAGLVLWGKGCGTANLFGVYANVANYRTWIDSVLGNNILATAGPPLVSPNPIPGISPRSAL